MAEIVSEHVLKISLTMAEDNKRVIEKLRKWAVGHNPPVRIWPAGGTSSVIEIYCSDSCGPSVWKEIKREVTRIVRREARKRNKGGK